MNWLLSLLHFLLPSFSKCQVSISTKAGSALIRCRIAAHTTDKRDDNLMVMSSSGSLEMEVSH